MFMNYFSFSGLQQTKPCRVKYYQLIRASRTEQCICFWLQRSQLHILGKENVEKVFVDIMDMEET